MVKHNVWKQMRGTYQSWQDMKQRCLNPSNHNYPYYGARGIRVCQAWANSFDSFLSNMGQKPDGMTLERINSDGNYEPKNCRWATKKEQRLNQRNHNQNKIKTHCFRGHPFSGDNLRIRPNGQRECKTCKTALNRKYKLKARSAEGAGEGRG